MALEPERLQALLAFTRKQWKSPACQLCGHNEWAIDGPAEIAIPYPPGSFEERIKRPPTLACAAFTCRNCGNTVLVNMVVAGLVENWQVEK